jgi:hypothetical protein
MPRSAILTPSFQEGQGEVNNHESPEEQLPTPSFQEGAGGGDRVEIGLSEQFASFHKIGEEHMLKSGINIGFHEVDMILSTTEAEFCLVLADGCRILLFYLCRKYFQVITGFEVDETIRTILKIKIEFFFLIGDMK